MLAPATKRLVKFPFPFQGLNTTASSLVLNKGFCPVAEGIRFARGEISSQPALVGMGSFGSSPINGAFVSYRDDGSIVTIITTASTAATLDSTGLVWNASTFVPLYVGLDEDFWSFADVFGEIYTSNGVGSLLWSADGGVFTDISALGYSGRYLEAFAGRLVMANVFESGQQHTERVRWSVANSPRDFTGDGTAGAIDLVDLAGPITGLKAMGGRLFIHKRTGITVALETGLLTPPFAFQTVVDGIGTIAGRTLLTIHGVQFFLGEDDVYVYDGASAPQPIGEQIRKELFENINWARVRNCWAAHYADHHEYSLYVPTGSNQWPTVCYTFNYLDRTWTKRTHSSAVTAGSQLQIAPGGDTWDGGHDGGDDTWDGGGDIPWDAPSAAAHLIPFVGRSDGTTAYPSEGTTGLTTAAVVETGDWDLDKPGDMKTIDRIRLTVRHRNNATFAVSISIDGGNSFTTPQNATLTAVGGEFSLTTLFIPVVRTTAEFFRLRLSTSSRFALVSWEFEVVDRAEVR
ncbi:MAG TPA: hypothetical protein VFB61_09705 [Gemmatimonadales bacterium]|nr:hypothetical protein [Gemmatimonadales bacterium]